VIKIKFLIFGLINISFYWIHALLEGKILILQNSTGPFSVYKYSPALFVVYKTSTNGNKEGTL
jgi:hypothetical protein